MPTESSEPVWTKLIDRVARARAECLAAAATPYLPANGLLLDLGSGTGHNALALAARREGEAIEADVTDMHVVGGGPTLFDGRRLPFRDQAFEAATAFFVLQYPADPAGLLSELRRVTRRRVVVVQAISHGALGKLRLAATEALFGPAAAWFARATGYVDTRPWSLAPRRLYSHSHLLATLEAAGFRVEHSGAIARAVWLASGELIVLEPHPRRPGSKPKM